jgi:hypothetical protein
MKKIFAIFAFLGLVIGLGSCTPALQDALANSLNQSSQQAAANKQIQARQDAINRTPPVIGAKCVSRDGQVRLNQLRQGINACFFSALVAPELGVLSRVDAVILLRFSSKPDLRYQESFETRDDAWRGQRLGFIFPLIMPDSLTGAVLAGASGLTKVAFSQILQARFDFIFFGIQVSTQLPVLDARTAQFFDAEGNFRDSGSRFSNLGERPYQALVQLRACSTDGVCVTSPVTELATR